MTEFNVAALGIDPKDKSDAIYGISGHYDVKGEFVFDEVTLLGTENSLTDDILSGKNGGAEANIIGVSVGGFQITDAFLKEQTGL